MENLSLIGEKLIVQGKEFTIKSLLGKGKAAYSYLIEHGDEKLVYKKMHEEHVDYYNFSNKLMSEVEAYKRILGSGIALPRLIEFNDEKQYLIKEYIDGDIAAELAAKRQLNENHFQMIFQMNNKLKNHGIHIDYFPTNFIYCENELYCIDYECHHYNAEWDFENWGIYYWLNSDGMKEHLDTGEALNLNKPGQPKPISEPFEQEKQKLMKILG